MRRAFQFHVITGLDPVISSSALDEMAVSSTAMTVVVPAHLPLARDGRVKHGHDVVVEAGSEAFAGMTIREVEEGTSSFPRNVGVQLVDCVMRGLDPRIGCGRRCI